MFEPTRNDFIQTYGELPSRDRLLAPTKVASEESPRLAQEAKTLDDKLAAAKATSETQLAEAKTVAETQAATKALAAVEAEYKAVAKERRDVLIKRGGAVLRGAKEDFHELTNIIIPKWKKIMANTLPSGRQYDQAMNACLYACYHDIYCLDKKGTKTEPVKTEFDETKGTYTTYAFQLEPPPPTFTPPNCWLAFKLLGPPARHYVGSSDAKAELEIADAPVVRANVKEDAKETSKNPKKRNSSAIGGKL